MYDVPLQEEAQKTSLSKAGVLVLRMLPWYPTRRVVGDALAACVRLVEPQGRNEAAPPTLSTAATRELLRAQGLAPIPPVFTAAELAEVRAFFDEQELVGRDGQRFRPGEAPDDVGLGSYPLATLVRCPHLLDLANRPEVLQVARDYLGCAPTISGLRVDWSAPSKRSPGHVQRFHRDYDDWRFLKLFVYLTDVDDGGGPHEYVLGLQRGSGRFRAEAYSDEEVVRQYGTGHHRRVVGPAGTSFMADTWGIHKGNVPTTGPRMLLQIQYSVLPVFKFAYRPVELAQATRYDRYVNRLILTEPSTTRFSEATAEAERATK
ncbi:MAG: hypothetical protein QM765_17365 [Myxococcales bacterium]